MDNIEIFKRYIQNIIVPKHPEIDDFDVYNSGNFFDDKKVNVDYFVNDLNDKDKRKIETKTCEMLKYLGVANTMILSYFIDVKDI
jgi:hypothetical protein